MIMAVRELKPEELTPAQREHLSALQVIGSAIKNIPASGYQFAKDTVAPFIHPIDTLKGLGTLAGGTVQKFIPGEQPSEHVAERFWHGQKERYGGLENIKRTIARDPIGVAGDVATIISPFGALLRGTKLGRAGQKLSKIGQAIDPGSYPGQIIRGTKKLMVPEGIPEKMYRSALKLNTTIPYKDQLNLLKTGLTDKIWLNVKGLEKIESRMSGLRSIIEALVDDAASKGVHLTSVHYLTSELDKLKDTTFFATDRRAIENVKKDILKGQREKGAMLMNPRDVQNLKKQLNATLESDFGKRTRPVKNKALHMIRVASKDFLENIMPEIKQLNKREGAYIALIKAIEQKVNRISNRDLIGIGIPIKTTAGTGLGYIIGDPAIGAMGGLLFGILDTPQVKSALAIVIKALDEQRLKLPPPLSPAEKLGLITIPRLTAFQAGRATREMRTEAEAKPKKESPSKTSEKIHGRNPDAVLDPLGIRR
jgi:hypothetical protein